MDQIEKERRDIPVEAIQFWEQHDFKALLEEKMDKPAFYTFSPEDPEEEKLQGMTLILIKMLKIRRSIKMLNFHPEITNNTSTRNGVKQ